MTEQITRSKKNVRPLLWLVLAISATGNVITSSVNGYLLVHLGLGLVALASAAGLVVDHYRNRQ